MIKDKRIASSAKLAIQALARKPANHASVHWLVYQCQPIFATNFMDKGELYDKECVS